MFSVGRVVLSTLLLCAAIGMAVARADEQDSSAADKAAIQQAAAAYLAAIRQGDAEKIAACWTAAGDFIDPAGQVHNGRRLAQKAVKASQTTGTDLEPQVESIRFVTPDVAIEDGTLDHAEADFIRYTAVWVRRDERWLLDSVRETACEARTHYDHLRPLAWLVGDWKTAEDSPVRVAGSCQWSQERNFLLREIKLTTEDGDTMTVTQRFGWDPLAEQIRVWSFDSAGGHSDGVLAREGNQWIVLTKAVTPDGKPAESRNVYTRIDQDTFSVESHSTVDDELLPNRKLRLVRSGK
jgi:uncharacterized protein (TIGR02246 family)